MAILIDYYNTGDNEKRDMWGAYKAGQVFTASQSYVLDSVKLKLARFGSTDYAIKGQFYTVVSNLPAVTLSPVVSIAKTSLATAAGWVEFNFATSSIVFAKDAQYAFAIQQVPDAAYDNRIELSCVSVGTYAGGNCVWYIASWSQDPAGSDYVFEVYGSGLTDKSYSKKLIAVANNEFWYESAPGTMEKFTAATGIDTLKSLSVAVGLQKVFVANVNNLYIADFANIKLPTSQIGTVGISAPMKGLTLTGGTSGAKLLSDFCTASTGSAYLYGYKITATSFISGETITGGAAGSVSFALVSAQVSPPHWYTWTPQFNDTTNYYTMPSQAALACLYCGRIVLSGNTQKPHQWYMSRILDPFDWLYRVNDPLTAIRGGNADAGEIGDIIKALIPYQDDYLIYGCANSMWLLRGDAASGGSIQPIIETTGIFGARAWCFDGNNNLYFFGQNGFYRIPIGQFSAENLSELALPEWVKDWNLDEATHRIVLTFDPFRHGITISKTTLADGTNENYWYDLKTQGFFPETYPADCGIYCSHFYNSTEGNYRKLLLGSADGYIREFDDSTKDDVTSASTAVEIQSHVVCPILPISESDKESKIDSITVINAGGAISGAISDSDSVALKFYIGNSAEETLEDIKDGASALLSVKISGTGRSNQIRAKLRGSYLGVRASNSAVSESWSLERLWCNIRQMGGS